MRNLSPIALVCCVFLGGKSWLMWLEHFVPAIITSFLIKEVWVLWLHCHALSHHCSSLQLRQIIDWTGFEMTLIFKAWFCEGVKSSYCFKRICHLASRRKATAIFSNNGPVISLLEFIRQETYWSNLQVAACSSLNMSKPLAHDDGQDLLCI